jgi:hypothetical protein
MHGQGIKTGDLTAGVYEGKQLLFSFLRLLADLEEEVVEEEQ